MMPPIVQEVVVVCCYVVSGDCAAKDADGNAETARVMKLMKLVRETRDVTVVFGEKKGRRGRGDGRFGQDDDQYLPTSVYSGVRTIRSGRLR